MGGRRPIPCKHRVANTRSGQKYFLSVNNVKIAGAKSHSVSHQGTIGGLTPFMTLMCMGITALDVRVETMSSSLLTGRRPKSSAALARSYLTSGAGRTGAGLTPLRCLAALTSQPLWMLSSRQAKATDGGLVSRFLFLLQCHGTVRSLKQTWMEYQCCQCWNETILINVQPYLH